MVYLIQYSEVHQVYQYESLVLPLITGANRASGSVRHTGDEVASNASGRKVPADEWIQNGHRAGVDLTEDIWPS